MKRTLLAATLVCGLASTSFASAADSARIWTYKYILATAETERELAPITEHIIKTPALQVPGLMDVAAESLLARFSDARVPDQNKIRLIRVLEKYKGPRYHATLRQVLERSRQPLVQEAAEKALPRKEISGGDSYLPGTVDLRAIVGEPDTAALAAKPTTEQGEHLARFPGGTLDQLFEWAGRPHQVVSGQTRVSDGMLIHVKLQRLTFFYRGLGRVVYGYKVNSWEFQAVVADPLAFENEFLYRDRAKELGMPDGATLEMIQLVSTYTSAMRVALRRNYSHNLASREFLDTAAELLLQEHARAPDPAAIDAYAWICRLLVQNANRRYTDVLARVARETHDEKLRRYATLVTEEPAGFRTEPYVPGTVNLAAQRAKYPSLYPASTYTSGQL